MSSTPPSLADRVRQALTALSVCVREMTPAGAKPIPPNPVCFNLLAWPVRNGCRICGLPGHSSANIQNGAACHGALNALVAFWDRALIHIYALSKYSERFQKAVKNNKPTYEMRLDGRPVVGGDLEVVLVDRLTCNWLKFQAHFSRVRAKANVLLSETEIELYEDVARELNALLCHEFTLSELYEQSIDETEQ